MLLTSSNVEAHTARICIDWLSSAYEPTYSFLMTLWPYDYDLREDKSYAYAPWSVWIDQN